MLEENAQMSLLIVDDLADNRMLLHLDLEDELAGVKIDEATGGKQALQLICENDYSVVICDFMMPEMDGFELFEEVKTRCTLNNMPPFIFLSANKQKEVAEQGLRIGAMDFMTKPYDLVELIFKIKNLARIKLLNDSLKESKAHMAEVNKKLEQLNREKDDMLRIVSHDMRDPLNSIQGLSSLIKNRDYKQDDIPEFGEIIHRSSEKLLTLVNTILEMSKIESGNLKIENKEANISKILDDIVQNFEVKAVQKNIQLTCKKPDRPVSFFTDATRFDQIVNNLVSNALKFTESGGRVDIKLEKISENHSSPHKSNGFRVAIKDSGIGIPQEMMPTLFDKFSKNQRYGTQKEEGNGLGLYIVKQLTELLGATIEVESTEGRGTTFTLEFEADK